MSSDDQSPGAPVPVPGDVRDIRLRLGVDAIGRPVGTLQTNGDPEIEFVGWVALMADLGAWLPSSPLPESST